MGIIHYLLIALAGVFMLIGVFLYFLYKGQEKMIFYPEYLPASYEFNFEGRYDELYFSPRKNIKLNALLFKVDNPKGLIIYFHGNAGSIASWGHRAKDFTKHGWDVLIWDYRGYGKSSGQIRFEKQIHADAEFIYQSMSELYQKERIGLVGCSLGTGVATKLAVQHPNPFLILVTPYFNFKHVVDHHYPILPTSIVLKYQFRSDQYLKNVNCPVYLIHGTNDETVPYESSVLLSEIDPGNIKLVTIEGGLHNNLPEFKRYQQTIREALETANAN